MIINVPETIRDRILIVENDPLVADLIARQALLSAGYQTQVVSDATTAISRAMQSAPDAIIANLDLPGLSGKDLMVALTSQGLNTPVIVLARKGQEADIIQAFRLGAVDYMLWPLKEPEVINVVERVLRSGRERKERENLARQLQRTNQELQARVRELTTIFAIGKAVTSITDQALLFERILEGATRVAQADLGWFLVRSDEQKPFLLVAQRGLPASVAEHIQQPWDDGISSLVALSGEPLSIHGEPVRRFKIAGLGQAALIVPIKVVKQVIGLLVVMRRSPQPFTTSDQHLMQAMADYASISLSNARLFRTVEERARSLEAFSSAAQTGEKIDQHLLTQIKTELRVAQAEALLSLEKLAKDPTARWNPEQRHELTRLEEQLETIGKIHRAISLSQPVSEAGSGRSDLCQLARQAEQRFQSLAQQGGLSIAVDVPAGGAVARANPALVAYALDGMLSYAVRVSNRGGQVLLRVQKISGGLAQVLVKDAGPGLDAKQAAHVWSSTDQKPGHSARAQRFGGLGVPLAMVKEIITQQHGKVWSESEPGAGTRLYFSLPAD